MPPTDKRGRFIAKCARCSAEFDSTERGKTRRADIYCSMRCADLAQPDMARVTEAQVERALEAARTLGGMLDTRTPWHDSDRSIAHEILATIAPPSSELATVPRAELEACKRELGQLLESHSRLTAREVARESALSAIRSIRGPNGEDEAKLARIVSAYICANNYINALTEPSVPKDSLEKIAQTYHEAVRAV